MADIVLSAAVRGNLLALQNSAKLLGVTQERLATGLKVNSALDDPTAFFTSASLNSRAGDLNRLLDAVDLSVQTLKAADDGISSILKLVDTAKAAANQALQKTSTVASVAGTTALSGSAKLNTLNFANGDTVQINAGGVVTTFTVTDAANQSVGDLVSALDANTNASVRLSGTGMLEIEVLDSGSLTLSEGTQGTNLDDLGLTAGTTTSTTNTDRQGFAAQFNEIVNQISQLARDAKFNAINLLDGDTLTVVFNEDSSSKLVMGGVDFTAAGLGLSASADNFQGKKEINAVLSALDGATATLRQQASTFGTNLNVVEVRRDFTKNLINTLETGAAGLTLADTNEEGANLLALQTRQQLSSTALSMASQADQNVLRLFQ